MLKTIRVLTYAIEAILVKDVVITTEASVTLMPGLNTNLEAGARITSTRIRDYSVKIGGIWYYFKVCQVVHVK